jgi:hypothetical protein
MKSLTLVFLSFFLFSSCCNDGPYPVAALKVKYPNLSVSGQLQAVRTERNSFSSIIDTIFLGELNESNSFSAIIEFEENSPDFILFIEGTTYTDTISEISFERKSCREKIINFEYKFNGDLRAAKELIID